MNTEKGFFEECANSDFSFRNKYEASNYFSCIISKQSNYFVTANIELKKFGKYLQGWASRIFINMLFYLLKRLSYRSEEVNLFLTLLAL